MTYGEILDTLGIPGKKPKIDPIKIKVLDVYNAKDVFVRDVDQGEYFSFEIEHKGHSLSISMFIDGSKEPYIRIIKGDDKTQRTVFDGPLSSIPTTNEVERIINGDEEENEEDFERDDEDEENEEDFERDDEDEETEEEAREEVIDNLGEDE